MKDVISKDLILHCIVLLSYDVLNVRVLSL